MRSGILGDPCKYWPGEFATVSGCLLNFPIFNRSRPTVGAYRTTALKKFREALDSRGCTFDSSPPHYPYLLLPSTIWREYK